MSTILNFSKEKGASLTGMLTKSLVLLGLVYLIVISSYMEGALNPILLSALLLIYLFTRSKGDLGIEMPSLVFLLVLILTSFISIDPRRSFYQVWLIGIGIFLIYFTARIVQLGFSSRTIINFLLLIGFGFMIFSWLDAGRWYLIWRSSYPDEIIPGISFRLNGGNIIAAYYHGILMMGLARLVYSRTHVERFAFGAYCLSAALLIFLSSSRGAYLGVMGGLLVLIVLQWSKLKERIPLFQSLFKRFRILILGTGIIALLVIAAFGYWYLQNMQSHPTHGAALQSRNEFWGPAWDAFLRSPWIGNGPYTFASEYMHSASVPPSPIFLHAHSMYLDILSGSGLVGLLASGWLIGALLCRLWHSSGDEDNHHSIVIHGTLLALSSFLIHSIFDGLYLMPFAALNLCLLMGSALGESKGSQRRHSLLPLGLGIGVAALAWLNCWLTTPYQNGLEAAAEGDFKLAAEQFALSAQRDPHLALTHQQLGLAESILASEGDQAALDRAIRAMEETVRLDPAYSPNHANLGALYRERVELESAADAFERAMELAPGWPPWHINLAEVYEAQEKWELSAQAYGQALSMQPEWAADGFWTGTPFRSEVLAAWQEAKAENPREEVLYTEEQVTHQPSAVPILKLAAQKIEQQDFPAAERLLGVAQLAYYSTAAQRLELVWLKAELAAARADWTKAISLGEEALGGFRLQGAYGPGSAGETLYGTGIFRTRMMKDELVPQLTLIQLPDPWPERMIILSGWHQQAGDLDACQSAIGDLLHIIPDFPKLHPNFELDCHSM